MQIAVGYCFGPGRGCFVKIDGRMDVSGNFQDPHVINPNHFADLGYISSPFLEQVHIMLKYRPICSL